jgi:hypothetical protein
MKTPRDTLFERHRCTETKLDAIRQETLARITERNEEHHVRAHDRSAMQGGPSAPGWWQDFLLSLRWHLAGLGAAWLAILLLNVDRASGPPSAKAGAHNISARQFMAAVQENRRQVRELSSPTGVETKPPVPGPRSSLQESPILLL